MAASYADWTLSMLPRRVRAGDAKLSLMKRIMSAFSFAFALALGAQAQTNSAAADPALAPPAGQPGARAEVPAGAGEQDFDPAWSANPNISAAQLAVLLPRLERQLVQTRARITALTQPQIFNGNMARLQHGVPGAVPAAPQGSGANLAQDLSTNYSGRAGVDLSANLAVPSGPGIPPDSQMVPNAPSPADPAAPVTAAPGQRNVVVQALGSVHFERSCRLAGGNRKNVAHGVRLAQSAVA